jgi:imidazolonepropionase-like amidohydrolase
MKSIFGKLIYTGNGIVQNSYLIFNEEKIIGIKDKQEGELVGEYEVITPAFIDAHSHIGMERAGEPGDEGEANEKMESVLFTIDALDSIQMDDKSFKDSIKNGVLYSCVLPGSGNIIGGKSVIIRNYSRNTNDAFIKHGGIKAAFGYNPMSTTEWKGTRPSTRMGAVGILRNELEMGIKNIAQMKKDKKIIEELSPRDETIIALLEGKERLRIHVHKEDDVSAVLRIKKKYNLNLTIEHACNFNTIEAFNRLKEEKISLIYGPLDSFAYKVELKDDDTENVKKLIESGLEFGIMTDHPVVLQRNLILQLKHLLKHGMKKEDCIKVITKTNAKILEIDDVLGTLEKDKWASFICWNGDPFSLESYPLKVYGEGKELI